MDFSTLGKEPIHPDQPTGSDLRYDPVFDQLQAEIDRASQPSLAGAVDWEKVIALSADILSHRSKDLQVAGYLAVGLIHARRMEGLTLALRIYRDLIEQHGPALFPQRERARLRSVQWWLEKSEAALKPLEGAAVAPAQLALMEENLAKLGELLPELLPEAPPLRALQEFLQNAAPSPQTDDTGPLPQQVVPAHSPHPSPQDPIIQQTPRPAPSHNPPSVEEVLHRLRGTADLLRGQDICNPLAYRLCRQANWLTVAEPPPAVSGRTRLSPPSPALLARLADLRRAGDPLALLGELEAQLSQFIFWLNLNRWAAEALFNLDHAQAAAAVCQETVSLVRRLPGVEELAFADGTPFADPETRQWLKRQLGGGTKREVVPLPGAEDMRANDGGETVAGMYLLGANRSGNDWIGMRTEAAGALIEEGRLIEAVHLFQEELHSTKSGRERLKWRLAFSRLLIGAKQTKLALPLLEQVMRDIERHDLEAYDPALALDVLKLARHGFDSQDDPRLQEKAEEAMHRIARIDLVQMIRLTDG